VGEPSNTTANNVLQIPYVIDTAGFISGLRFHWPYSTASATAVINNYEAPNGVTLGAAEALDPSYRVVEPGGAADASTSTTQAPSGHSVELEWPSPGGDSKSFMRAHLRRGSPYVMVH